MALFLDLKSIPSGVEREPHADTSHIILLEMLTISLIFPQS